MRLKTKKILGKEFHRYIIVGAGISVIFFIYSKAMMNYTHINFALGLSIAFIISYMWCEIMVKITEIK